MKEIEERRKGEREIEEEEEKRKGGKGGVEKEDRERKGREERRKLILIVELFVIS